MGLLRIRLALCLALCWLAVIPISGGQEQTVPPLVPLENLLPPDTVLFVRVENLQASWNKAQKSPLGKILNQDSVKRYLDGLVQKNANLRRMSDLLGLKVEELIRYFPNEFAMAQFYGADKHKLYIFSVGVNKNNQQFVEWANAQIRAIATAAQGRTSDEDADGIRFTAAENPDGKILVGSAAYPGRLIFYFHADTKKALLKALRNSVGAKEVNLSSRKDFQDVKKRVGSGDCFAWGKISEMADETAVFALKLLRPELGAHNIVALGGSLTVNEKFIEDRIFVLAPNRKDDLLSVFDAQPPDPKIHERIPHDSLACIVGKSDFPQAWKSITSLWTLLADNDPQAPLPFQQVEKFWRENTAQGINEQSSFSAELAGIDRDFACGLLLDDATLKPFFVFKVKDQAGIQRLANLLIGSQDIIIKKTTVAKQELYYFNLDNKFVTDFGYCLMDGYVVAAPPLLLRNMLEKKGKPITANEAFAKIRPAFETNGAWQIFIDTPKLASVASNYIPMLELRSKNKEWDWDFTNFPPRQDIVPLLSPSAGSIVSEPKGVLLKMQTPTGLHIAPLISAYFSGKTFEHYFRKIQNSAKPLANKP